MAKIGKAILLIGDGLGDRPVAELGGKTPLEAAETPNLDRIALEGENGLLDPIAPGIPPGSDTAHLALLGYHPYEVYTGRGPFEALGIGMEVRPGDVCFRCNFSTVTDEPARLPEPACSLAGQGPGLVVTDRRAGRISEGTKELAQALNGVVIEGVTCLVKESVEHRAALILRGEGLGHNVTDVDPHEDGKPVLESRGLDERSRKTAQVLNEFVRRSFKVLSAHPVNAKRRELGEPEANILLPRGAGLAPHLKPFSDLHGFAAAFVVEVGLVKGIGRYIGAEVVDAPGATGGHDTDELALARAAAKALERQAFVLCNLKAPDLGGHDRNPSLKIRDIEKLDRLAGELLRLVPEDALIVVTGDHSTPVSVGDHTGDPLPIVFHGPAVRRDGVKAFGERAAGSGGMGRLSGSDLMNLIANFMGAKGKFGA
jgi:2,3-bisphosphoglycerate-independent phosphoglycerate mutase